MMPPLSEVSQQPVYLPQVLDWQTFSHALFNATHNIIFVVDRFGSVIISNQMAKEKFGVHPGKRLEDPMPEFWPMVAAALKDREYRTGIPLAHAGTSFLARIGPIWWRAEMIGALCILDDVTELEQATSKLKTYQECRVLIEARQLTNPEPERRKYYAKILSHHGFDPRIAPGAAPGCTGGTGLLQGRCHYLLVGGLGHGRQRHQARV
ncbi:MAG: hypothetical protein WAM73_10635 [Desulfobacterales bacterium]